MEYSVRGITFSEDDLSTIGLNEIKASCVSPCHLFAFLKDQPLLLLRAGDYIEEEFIKKYQSRGVASFKCLMVAKPEHILVYQSLFKEIKNARDHKAKTLAKDKLIKLFGDDYWRESDKSFLSFVVASFNEFFNLPSNVLQNLQSTSLTLYSRSLLTSAITVMNCLVEEIPDFLFIKDMYNASFLMDYGLVEQGEVSYLLLQACEKERNQPGTGLAFLKNHPKSGSESSIFFKHPILSAAFANKLKERFHYPEVIDHIGYHHEKSDGSGFPNGHSYSGLAQSETMLMFADYMTPFQEGVFQAGDGSKIIKEAFVALNALEGRGLVPINRGIEAWESCMDWTRDEIVLEKESQKEAS